jgi:ferredoxin
MALMISDDCVCCAACLEVCPNNAIREDDPIYVIDPDICTECVGYYSESQCVKVCPVEAIVPDLDHEVTYEELLQKSKRLQAD